MNRTLTLFSILLLFTMHGLHALVLLQRHWAIHVAVSHSFEVRQRRGRTRHSSMHLWKPGAIQRLSRTVHSGLIGRTEEPGLILTHRSAKCARSEIHGASVAALSLHMGTLVLSIRRLRRRPMAILERSNLGSRRWHISLVWWCLGFCKLPEHRHPLFVRLFTLQWVVESTRCSLLNRLAGRTTWSSMSVHPRTMV